MAKASGEVVLRMSAAEAGVVQKWMDVIRQGPAAMGKEMDTLSGKTNKAAGNMSGQFSKVGRDITRVAGDFLGLGSAIGSVTALAVLLKSEAAAARSEQERSKRRQIDEAGAERAAAIALGIGSNLTKEELSRRLRSDRSGVDTRDTFLTAEAGLSTKGTLPASQVVDTVLELNRQRPFLEAEQRRAFATGSLAVQRGFGMSPKEAISAITVALSSAATQDIEKFSKNLIPAIVNARAFGGDQDTFQDLASLFIGVGQRSLDPTGSVTASGTTNALKQILIHGAQRGVFQPGTSVAEQLNQLTSGRGEAEKLRRDLVGVLDQMGPEGKGRVEGTRDQQALAESLRPLIQGESKTFVAISELLNTTNRSSRTWDEIRQAASQISGDNRVLVAQAEEQTRSLNALASQQTALVDKALEASIQALEQDPSRGVPGLSDEQFERFARLTGSTAIGAKVRRQLFSLRQANLSPEDQRATSLEALEGFEGALARPRRPLSGPLGLPSAPQPSAEQFEIQQRTLQEIRDLQARLVELQEGGRKVQFESQGGTRRPARSEAAGL